MVTKKTTKKQTKKTTNTKTNKEKTEGLAKGPFNTALHVLQTLRRTKDSHGKQLLSDKEYKHVLLNVVNANLQEAARQQGITSFKGLAAPVLVSTKDGVLARPLGTMDKHPDFKEWKTADEIGHDWGLTSDKVRKYISEYEAGVPLRANALAEEWVSNYGFPKPDNNGFLQFMNDHKNCVAVWAMREGGGINWRNYWHPDVAQGIQKLIQADLGAPPEALPGGLQTTQEQARA